VLKTLVKMTDISWKAEFSSTSRGFRCAENGRFWLTAVGFLRPHKNLAQTTNGNSRLILFAEEVCTQVSFSAKKRKAVFSVKQIMYSYLHRVKTTSFKWTSHIRWHCGPLYWVHRMGQEGERKHRVWSTMWFKGRGDFFDQRNIHLCKICWRA